MHTLARNSANDLFVSAGGLAIAKDANAQSDIIRSIILTQQGELQFDANGGIDYFGTVFQNARYIDLWAAEVRTKIKKLSWVESITDFTYEFNRETSSVIWTMTVNTTNGNKLTITPRNKIPEDKPLRYELDWNSIYNKPRGAEEAAATVKRMKAGRTRQPEDGLTRASTWMDAKKAINDIVLRPNGVTDRDATDDIRFSVTAEGDGATVEGGGLGVTATGEWMIDWGDGNYEYVSGNTNPEHTYETAGDYIIVLSGAISKIESTTDGTCAIRGVTIKGFGVGERAALTEIGNSLFYGNASLKTVEVKSPLAIIGTRAFGRCTALESLEWMPATVAQLGASCFTESGLKSIDGLSASIEALPAECFAACESLTSIVGLPPTLKTIGPGCFLGCINVTEIYIPSEVNQISMQAFWACIIKSGSSIRCDANTPPIADGSSFDSRAFENATLYVPQESLSEYQSAEVWQNFLNRQGIASITFTLEGVPAGTKLLGGTSCIKSGSPWTVDYGDGTPVKVMASAETGIPEHIYAEGGASIAIKVSGSITEIASAVDANDATTSTSYPIICTNDKTKSEYLTGFDFDNGLPLKKIGSNCFCGCENLSGIKSFGETSGCEFGNRAFYRCKSLASLSWLPNVGDAKFGSYCFAVCTALTSDGAAYITSATNRIPPYCFYGCDGLSYIPTRGINIILGEGCFMASGVNGCDGLQVAGEGNVPDYCFADCKNIRFIGGGIEVSSFGAHCFDGCTNLESFAWSTMASLTLGKYCFANCTKLESLGDFHIQPITAISDYCFSGCTALKNLSGMGDSVTSIGEAAFENCTSLYTLQGISKSLVTIGARAFDGCSQIKRIDWLPKTVESIGSKAFRGCPIECIAIACYKKVADSEVVTVPTLASDAFGTIDYSSVPLYVMPQALDAYKSASVWQNFSAKTRYVKLTINGLDTAYGIIGGGEIAIRNENESGELSQAAWIVDWGDGSCGYLDTNIETTLPWHRYESSDEYEITIFGDIRSIDGELSGGIIFKATSATAATDYLEELRGLEVNADMRLESIGPESFRETGLENVKLAFRETSEEEDFFSSIGDTAFHNCWNLERVEMPDSRLAADTVEAFAFAYCTSLKTLIGFGGVRQLGEGVFIGCSSLKSTIGLGSDLKSIGSEAFLDTNLLCVEMVAKTPPAIQADTFPDYGIDLYVPANAVDAYRTWSEDNPYWPDFYPNIKTRYIKIGIGDDFVGIVNGTRSGTEIVPIDSSTVTTKDASEGESEFYVDWGDGSPVEFVYGSSLPYHEYKNTVAEETEEETSSEPQPVFVTIGGNIVSISGMIGHASEGNTYFPFISGDATAQSVNVSNLPDFNSFGECCFKGCTNLTKIEVDSGNRDYIGSHDGMTIGDYAFAGCTSFEMTEALQYVTSVGACAFLGCTAIESLTALTNLEEIGGSAFEDCTSLTRITTATDAYHTIKSISSGAFKGCVSLVSLNGLSKVGRSNGYFSDINDYAFAGCTALTSLEGLPTSGSRVIIWPHAFEGCTGLASLEGAGRVKYIEDEAFLGCTGLKTTRGLGTVIGESPDGSSPNLGHRCFSIVASYDMMENESGEYVPDPTSYTYTCPLEEVVIPATGRRPSVPSGDSPFQGMATNDSNKYIVPLQVPAAEIGNYRGDGFWGKFANIFPITSTTAGATVGNILFTLTNVAVGTSVVSGSMTVTFSSMYMIDWGDGTHSYVKEGESFPSHTYATAGNYTIGLSGPITKIASSSSDDAAIRLSGEGALTGFSVAAGTSLTEIGDYAFYNCTSLSSVTIASGVNTITAIGESAFRGCTALTSIAWLPTTVTTLGDACFRESALTSIASLSSTGLTALPDYCFYGCESEQFTEIVSLPSNLKTIGEYCFYNCTNVVSITIPSKVTTIGSYAFSGCCQTFGNIVTSNATTPPTASSGFFSNLAYSNAQLRVPTASTDDYDNASYWNSFQNIFPASPADSQEAIKFTISGVKNATVVTMSNMALTTSRAFLVDWGDGNSNMYAAGTTVAGKMYNGLSSGTHDMIISIVGPITKIARVETANQLITMTDNCKVKGLVVGTGASLQTIEADTFNETPGLETVELKANTISTIGARAFKACTQLYTMKVESTNLSSLGTEAFSGCIMLNAFEMDKATRLYTLPTSCFENCIALETIDKLPANLNTIGEKCFFNCTDVTELHIPSTVYSIYTKAFNGTSDGCCTGTDDPVYCYASSPPTIYADTFHAYAKSRAKFYVPAGSVTSYQGASNWSAFSTRIVAIPSE